MGAEALAESSAGARGRLERKTLKSGNRERDIELTVYLPRGFSPERRYPAAYALDKGEEDVAAMTPTLDNLNGRTTEPLIVVFVPYFGIPYLPTYMEYVGDGLSSYVRVLLEEIVPFVDESYPTLREASGRGLLATMNTTYTSVYTAFRHPGVFSRLGLQTMRCEAGFRAANRSMLQDAPRQALTIYLDWGKYDGKSEREIFDARAFSVAFAEDLRAAGYPFTGGEVHDGSGPDSWLGRTDRVLETLFPPR